MSSILHSPKAQLILALFLIYLTALKEYPTPQSLYLLLVSVGFVVFFDVLFTFYRKRRFFVPYSAVITGLIITLTINPDARRYEIAVATAVAMAAKNFIRFSGRHVFNPAAIGLFIVGILFNQYVTWWGVSFQNPRSLSFYHLVAFLILVSPAVVSVYRMRRVYSIFSFLISYTLFSHIFTFTLSLSSFISRMFDPGIVFFSIVMLPEPMTSPVRPKRQVVYGLLVAAAAQLIAYPPVLSNVSSRGLLPDLLLAALLLGNVLFFRFR